VSSQEIAKRVLTLFVDGEAEKERALTAAASLMRHSEDGGWWPFVWEARLLPN
jgi:hypothetical protein